MHAHARLNAKACGRVLYYVASIDIPAVRMSRQDFDDMRAQPNISTTAKFPGILPIYIGMEMILTESYLPPNVVRGTAVEVVDLQLHPMEANIRGRASIASHGCVVLTYMPKCIYVRLTNGCKKLFLTPEDAARQPAGLDLRGVLVVQPTMRTWQYKSKTMQAAVSASRTQCPLLPMKQCTLHGVQGKTAEPGFIAHWTFPVGLAKESKWLEGKQSRLSRSEA